MTIEINDLERAHEVLVELARTEERRSNSSSKRPSMGVEA